MTPEKSVLIFQLVHHPFDESLKSALYVDVGDLRVDHFLARYDSRDGSGIIPGPEYKYPEVANTAAEWYKNQMNAQIEKTMRAKKLCLDNDYDYFLYVTDDVIIPQDTLTLLIAEEKDFISGLVSYEHIPDSPIKFSGRILDPDGPQASDDRPIELHRDFEFGDVIPITWGQLLVALISRKVFDHEDFQGWREGSVWKCLNQIGIQAYLHTGVPVKYFGGRP